MRNIAPQQRIAVADSCAVAAIWGGPIERDALTTVDE
jgi:hypothetical protein